MSAQAVIFYSTADPDYNTTPPTGKLADSGWDLQGFWGVSLGTPISLQHFITAKHVGGEVGVKFVLDGVEYTTTAVFDDPNSDLRIWKISGRFPVFAQLYSRRDEVGENLIVFGRGTQRGSEVTASGLLGSVLKGWQWGVTDGRLRWGENQVGGIITVARTSNADGTAPDPQSVELLKVPFDARAGPNEAHLSIGDSGGGVFIKDGTAWKLAGINFTVDGPYNTSDSGPGFQAAIFDESGLYKGGEGNWTRIADLGVDTQGAFYATRISVRLSWISSVLAQSSSNDAPVLQSAQSVAGPYTDEVSANVDPGTKVITFPAPTGSRFYRLNGPTELRIINVTTQGGNVVFRYQ